jgi:hypothetical protein
MRADACDRMFNGHLCSKALHCRRAGPGNQDDASLCAKAMHVLSHYERNLFDLNAAIGSRTSSDNP